MEGGGAIGVTEGGGQAGVMEGGGEQIRRRAAVSRREHGWRSGKNNTIIW